MNKTKRGLELAGAIISIVINSIMALSFLVILTSTELLIELIEDQVEPGYYIPESELAVLENTMTVVCAIFLILSVISIVMSSLLCKSPIKNGEYKSRLGIAIPVIVILGIFALLTISNFMSFLLYATPFGLLLASVCMKNKVNKPYVATSQTINTEPNDNVQLESNVAEVVNNNNNIESIESQLLKLKELKDMGVIDETQYKQGVDKLINKL